MDAANTFVLLASVVCLAGCGAGVTSNVDGPARVPEARTTAPQRIATPPEPIAPPPIVKLADLATGTVLRGNGPLREQAVSCAGVQARRALVADVGLVDATQPLRDVEVSLTTSADLLLMITGPLADDGSLSQGGKVRCGRVRMELDGRYRVQIVVRGNVSGDVPYAIGFRHVGSRVDLAADATPVPADLPVAARELVDFYPWLLSSGGELDHAPIEWQRLFSGVDPGLFVYPRLDLDLKLASWYQPHWINPDEVVFPHKDEPLLVAKFIGDRAWVVAADGGRFTVPMRYLVARPSGPPRLPERVRNTVLNWIEATASATTEEKLEIAELDKLKQRFSTCRKKVFAKSRGPRINAYEWNVVTYVNGRVQRVENLGAKISQNADRTCNKAAVERAETRLFEKLVAGYVARSQAQLDSIRARFEK